MAFKDSLRRWDKIPFYLEQRGRGQAAGKQSLNSVTQQDAFGASNFSPLKRSAYLSPERSHEQAAAFRQSANRTTLSPLVDPEQTYNTLRQERHHSITPQKAFLANQGLNTLGGTMKANARATLQDHKIAETALMLDNPTNGHLNDISRYIKKLDDRLSIPKFNKFDDPNNSLGRSNSPLARSLSPK
jgi:hypothetical protein